VTSRDADAPSRLILALLCCVVIAWGTGVVLVRRPVPHVRVTRVADAPLAARAVNAGPRATSAPRRQAPRKPQPVPLRRFAATGELVTMPGTGHVLGRGPLRRFRLEIEKGLPERAADIAATVDKALGDPRGWAARLDVSLQRVGTGPAAFTVTLASPDTVDRLCRPLQTGGIFSCFMRGRAVLNVARWRSGAEAFGNDLTAYRLYLVNHEVGHALGFGHRSCPGRGRPAPVMVQQTIGVAGCRPNPWPVVA
jgi:hypothetical protein